MQADDRGVEHKLALIGGFLGLIAGRGDRLGGLDFLIDREGHELGRLGSGILFGILLVTGGNLQQVDRIAAGRHVEDGDALFVGLAQHALFIRAELHGHTLDRITVLINDLNPVAIVGKSGAAQRGKHHAEHHHHCEHLFHYSFSFLIKGYAFG